MSAEALLEDRSPVVDTHMHTLTSTCGVLVVSSICKVVQCKDTVDPSLYTGSYTTKRR